MIRRVEMVPFWFWYTFRIRGSRKRKLSFRLWYAYVDFFAQWTDLQKCMQNLWRSKYSRNQWTLFIQRFTVVVVPVWCHEEEVWLSIYIQLVGLAIQGFQLWPQVGCVSRKLAISNSVERSKVLCSPTDLSITVLQEYHVHCCKCYW